MITENYLEFWDVILIILYLIIFIFFGFSYARIRFFEKHRTFYYIFLAGLIARLFSGLSFGLIYDFYYIREADTFYYFWNASKIADLLWKSPINFINVFFGNVDYSNLSAIGKLGYHPILHNRQIFFLHRLLSIFAFIGLNNYYLASISLNAVFFLINWRVFMFFYEIFRGRLLILAFSTLFVPSVLFWSSGLLKDSFTYSFSLLFFVFSYKILMQYQFRIQNFIFMFLSAYIVLKLKPYILLSISIAIAAWFVIANIQQIKNKIIRVIIVPIFVFVGLLIGSAVIYMISQTVGGHFADTDAMLQKAVASYQDLKQEYYQGESFDFGDYEPTIQGALSKAHLAFIAAVFRPFLWEARSIQVFLAALENSVFLLIFLYLIVFGRLFILKKIIQTPFYLFCLFYTIVLGIIIGLSTSNFGALVRFKIPFLPFFIMMCLMLYSDLRQHKKSLFSK